MACHQMLREIHVVTLTVVDGEFVTAHVTLNNSHLVLGECAGLVRANHGGGTHSLTCLQMPHHCAV